MTAPVTPIRYPHAHAGRAGMGDVSDTVRRFARQAASGGVVRRVTLRSNISPDISLDPAQATGARPRRGRFSEALLRFAKPEIEVETPAGAIRVAPYGPPTTNLFWPVVILGTAGAAALTILAVRRIRR